MLKRILKFTLNLLFSYSYLHLHFCLYLRMQQLGHHVAHFTGGMDGIAPAAIAVQENIVIQHLKHASRRQQAQAVLLH